MKKPSKGALRDELAERLRAALATARAAHAAAIEGATHEEAKAENDKDTRGLEQSYVARGQAQRVEELAGELATVETLALRRFAEADAIAAGALVTVEEDGEPRRFFVAPGGGGEALAGGAVQVVTPRSPLGRALCGKRVGEVGEVRVPGGVRELDITAVE